MSNTIKLKRGSGSDPTASDLAVGEVALRTDTALLFTKNDGGSVVPIGISDGDKGDITVSSNGGTFTIDNDAVTYAKIQNVSATDRLLGRDSSGAGIIEEIAPSAVRTMLGLAASATTDTTNASNIGSGTLAAARVATLNQDTTGNAATATALETARTIAGVSFDGSANISLNNNAITNGAGYLTSVATSNIADDAVTYAKIQNVSATNRILGRDSSGAGAIEEITPANLRTMINVEDGATADQTNSEIAAALSDQRPSIRGADFTDDGTGSPLVHIKGDDGNPWGLIIGNDTYSTGSHGFAVYVDNNGDIDSRSRGNSEYRTWNIKQDDGSTVRALVTLSNDGSVYLRHQGNLKLGTSSSGVSVTGTCTATTFSGSGASLTSLPAGNLTGTLPAIDGSNLTGISAGATGGGSDEIFYENGQNVTTDYTITNGKNAMSAGPITIDSGVTVTVGAGETLTIV